MTESSEPMSPEVAAAPGETKADQTAEKPAAKAAKAPAKTADKGDKAEKPAAKKPEEPEPEVSPEDMADLNRVYARLYDVVERQRKPMPQLTNEAERAYDRLTKRVTEQAKDMDAFKKKVQLSVTNLASYARLTGGHAKLAQLHIKLRSLKELIEESKRL